MQDHYYLSDPRLREYFQSLPVFVRQKLIKTDVEISTLGELMICAERMMKESLPLE